MQNKFTFTIKVFAVIYQYTTFLQNIQQTNYIVSIHLCAKKIKPLSESVKDDKGSIFCILYFTIHDYFIINPQIFQYIIIGFIKFFYKNYNSIQLYPIK